MVFEVFDIMVMGCYFYLREEKRKEMYVVYLNIRIFCFFVIVFRENVF